MPPQRKFEPLKSTTGWAPGRRTPAWDALWRRILAEVLYPAKTLPEDTHMVKPSDDESKRS
jgi:hypothetical protein